ncbi:hypothetical protein TSAR_013168 [Trichomalopsis sarcophagae]|uniref:Uncharacterized protein n=1 Tax=Trichomalopsis sarcophagae TaxID=543379 RepID=A0A232EP73_9HYME|nr:hypothetical protein TSAR_013168 [Trichomalopsis sarcophagae]
MKTSNPPGIVMQHPTFEGLHLHSSLVDQRLDALKSLVGKINRTYDYVVEYLKTTLKAEEPQNIKNIQQF